MPLLQVGDTVISESAVICKYLDEITPGSLHPDDPLQKAQHRALIEFASTTLNDITGFYNADDASAFLERRDRLVTHFEWLEQHLNATPYFPGVDFSMLKAAFGPVFWYFDTSESSCGLDLLPVFANVREWRHVLSGGASVAAAVDDEYHERLTTLLVNRNSYISAMVDR